MGWFSFFTCMSQIFVSAAQSKKWYCLGFSGEPSSSSISGSKSSKWIIWGGMTGRGLTGIHFLPQGQTLTDNYYINNILEKEVKPVLHRKTVNEATNRRKLFSSNCQMMFVQDGLLAHAAKATQAWCKRNLPNFTEKTCWPPNSPDINPVESLWSIMDEVVYKDPTLKTMKDLKKWLKQA